MPILSNFPGGQAPYVAGQNISIYNNIISNKVPPCNQNMLDNWYFINPVNQRNIASGASWNDDYGLDRWKSNISKIYIGAIASAPTPILLLENSGTENQYFQQRVNLGQATAEALVGKNVTISCLCLQGPYPGMFSFTIPFPAAGNTIQNGTSWGRLDLGYAISNGIHIAVFNLILNGGLSLRPSAVKLELSDQQTLAHQDDSGNWILNEIPNKETEFIKCITSTADPTDTYANKVIATADKLCNPNLLDNWYFENLVNQRGQANYTGTGYGIDRWAATNSTTKITITSTGVTLQTTDSAGQPFLRQPLECSKSLQGQTVTLSALTTQGSLFSATSDLPTELPTSTTIYCNILNVCDLAALGGSLYARIKSSVGGAIAIRAVKLELGDTQTLAHRDDSGKWVLNEIPDFGEQLSRCQRFFYRKPLTGQYVGLGYGVAFTPSRLRMYTSLPVAMRAIPAVSAYSAAGENDMEAILKDPGTPTAQFSLTSITSMKWSDTSTICIEFATSGLEQGTQYQIRGTSANAQRYIDFSAEI